MVAAFLMKLKGKSGEFKVEKHSAYMPLQSFDVVFAGRLIGHFGTVSNALLSQFEIEEPIFYAEISLAELVHVKNLPAAYKEIPRFPSVARDLSLIVDEAVQAKDLADKIKLLGRNLIQKLEVFDLYRAGKLPKGKKSLAFHIYYQSNEKTLLSTEVNELHFSIINQLNREFKAELPPQKQNEPTAS